MLTIYYKYIEIEGEINRIELTLIKIKIINYECSNIARKARKRRILQ